VSVVHWVKSANLLFPWNMLSIIFSLVECATGFRISVSSFVGLMLWIVLSSSLFVESGDVSVLRSPRKALLIVTVSEILFRQVAQAWEFCSAADFASFLSASRVCVKAVLDSRIFPVRSLLM